MKYSLRYLVITGTILGTLVLKGAGLGQTLWTADGAPVCVSAASQEAPSIINDSSGNSIVVWGDQISGSNYNIFAQKLDSAGSRVWAADGISLCSAPFDQSFPVLASDGSGGAIVAWQDVRSLTAESDVYAQRIDANGMPLWAADGIPVCTAAGDQYGAGMCTDGSGGAYIAWRDTRNDIDGSSTDIYMQRIDSSGNRLWAADLALATSVLQDDRDFTILSDGAGGAIVVWQDGRGVTATPATGKDIYAQRVGPTGSLLWGAQGLCVCKAVGDQRYPEVTSDGAGGVLICWDDKRSGTDYDIYAQRVSANGNVQWAADGVPACVVTGSNQVVPCIASDGAGGAYVAWTDARSGSTAYYDIYAQRLTDTGAQAWNTTGVAVCAAPGWQGRIKASCDGSSGALFSWSDNRADPSNITYNYDIYCQRMDSAGVAAWATNGVAVCTASGKQDLHKMIVAGSGQAIIVWQDTRTDPLRDIFAQKIGNTAPATLADTVAAAKGYPDGARLRISGKTVTAVFGGAFYIEETDRSSGIRVQGTGASEGQSVTVEGELSTVSGERVLANASISNLATGVVPGPLMLSNKALGGSAFGAYTPGVTGASGLSNLGLLATTTGTVLSSGVGYVYIDDGSGVVDAAGNPGVKVDTLNLTSQPSGYVIVTGISGVEETAAGSRIRVLRPRRDADVISR